MCNGLVIGDTRGDERDRHQHRHRQRHSNQQTFATRANRLIIAQVDRAGHDQRSKWRTQPVALPLVAMHARARVAGDSAAAGGACDGE